MDKLTSEEARILVHMLDSGQISRKEATTLLGASNTKAYTLFEGLLGKGLITRRGQGRATCYVLAHKPKDGRQAYNGRWTEDATAARYDHAERVEELREAIEKAK